MTANELVVIFGSESSKKDNIIYVNEKDFQSISLDYKAANTTIQEIQRIENSLLDNKPIVELFSYGNFSMWWFFYTQIFDQFHKTISFVLKFSEFLENTKPNLVEIRDNFEVYPIIKQLCETKKIKIKISSLKLKKFNAKKKTNNYIKKKGSKIITERKIKNRIRIFHKKKKSLPNFDNKILFAVPNTYRREIFDLDSGRTIRGEYLVSEIINMIKKNEEIVCIDLFSQVMQDDSILQERLESNLEWLPVEIFFKNVNQKEHSIFLKKFHKIISSSEFQNYFHYNGVSLWRQLEDVFRKMEHAPYIPYWLTLVDSLTRYFSSVKPKAIFLPYETGPLALAFIVAASRLGIKTIGIQHGIITEYESAYSHQKFASKEFPFGFINPNKLLVFGEITKEILNQNNYPEERLEIFGNPTFFHLEEMKKILNANILYKKYGLQKNLKIISFIPPALIEYYESGSKYNYNTQVLNKLLEQFRNKMEFLVLIKPHPRDDIKFYEKILEENGVSNARIIQGNLLELLFMSSVVVSTFSNAIMDSLCFKKPIVQVTFDNLEVHLPHDSFDAVIKTTLSNLSNDIKEILSNDDKRTALIKKAEYFTKKCYNIPEKNPREILEKILT